jgi:hypothetical protein
MPDKVGSQEETLQGCGASLGDDVQHVAAVGPGHNSVHLGDNRAGDKVLAGEVHPCAVLRPAAGNEAADGQGTADGGKNEPSMVTGDLEPEELHGAFLPAS